MGDEARAHVRYGEEVSEGKALLETDELLFRGDFRVKIPLRSVEDVVAGDGSLTVVWEGESATFELGERAERWAERIRNPKTIVDKLGLKAGRRIALVNVPDEEIRAMLRERGHEPREGMQDGADVVLLGVASPADLGQLQTLAGEIARDGAIWVVAPKGGREPTEAQVLAAGRHAGLVDVKVARWSETHTAHKFVVPRERR